MSGLIVDLFAGGGGASQGIFQALGRHPDIAINHDAQAVSMHMANHPDTKHYCQDVWAVQPNHATRGRNVDLLWASPDCKHFSKAKGGKPRDQNIRDLAWVVVRWAEDARPNLIILENVEEFVTWGPLGTDGNPVKALAGKTFKDWVRRIRRLGYRVEWRELRACDYGAPTIRKRFFMIARCDGLPIVWPAPTHGDPKSNAVISGKLKPWRSAAEVIDFTLPCPSIFDRKRPLAENTLRRIARGIQRYVLDAAEPFIIQTGYGERMGQAPRVPDINKPLGTVVAGGVKHAVVMPHLQRQFGQSVGQPVAMPAPTVMPAGGGKTALVAAFMAQQRVSACIVGAGGPAYAGKPAPVTAPTGTLLTRNHKALAAAHVCKLRGTNVGHAMTEPLHTVSAQGTQRAEVRVFLLKYYGSEKDGADISSPLGAVLAKDKHGLVTVSVNGEPHFIADIGMRMLVPRELYLAQGFPRHYVIDRDAEGNPITKTAQVRMCGNSVPPDLSEALVKANYVANAGYAMHSLPLLEAAI